MIELNYSKKVSNLRKLIQMWKRRFLTPLGKFFVIKSLLLPLFNHLFISIPNPHKDTIKLINSLFYEFLWQGPAKIKNSIIIKKYFEGGLNMINLEEFIKSLKLTWIRIIIVASGKWGRIIEGMIEFRHI